MHDSKTSGLIIANGEPTNPDKVTQLAAGKCILVLDGAYPYAQKYQVKIDYLLGDFDSIKPKSLEAAKRLGITIKHAPDQNYTDLEKGILLFKTLGIKKIDIVSATGFRLDQTSFNLQLLTKYYDPACALHLHTNREHIFAIKDSSFSYNGEIGDGFAILGAPDCHATTDGLQYEMENMALCYGKRNSISNTMTKKTAHVTIHGSALIIHEKLGLKSTHSRMK